MMKPTEELVIIPSDQIDRSASYAVLRSVPDVGKSTCATCQETIPSFTRGTKDKAPLLGVQVVANVIGPDGKWEGTHTYHPGCYVSAEEPVGPPYVIESVNRTLVSEGDQKKRKKSEPGALEGTRRSMAIRAYIALRNTLGHHACDATVLH